jgi:putative flippase GtrA
MISFTIVFVAGNLAGFFLNKKYTFKTSKKHFWHELWKYYSVMMSYFLINLIMLYILVNYFHIWYLYASLITTIGGIFYNFVMHKKWSFK